MPANKAPAKEAEMNRRIKSSFFEHAERAGGATTLNSWKCSPEGEKKLSHLLSV
jgi:hypothetical protein